MGLVKSLSSADYLILPVADLPDKLSTYSLLLPANEVWGKVMFLHLSVILFTGGGCIPACNGQGGETITSQRAIGRGVCIPVCNGVWVWQNGMHEFLLFTFYSRKNVKATPDALIVQIVFKSLKVLF